MATITKNIQIGDYFFTLTLQSKSVHAHSLMTDEEDNLSDIIDGIIEELNPIITGMIVKHKEEKHL